MNNNSINGDPIDQIGSYKRASRSSNYLDNNTNSCSVRNLGRCEMMEDSVYDPPPPPLHRPIRSELRNPNRMVQHVRAYAGGENPSSSNRRKISLRYPLAFILATIVTFCGTCIFFGCLFMALSITRQMFRKAYEMEYDMEWLRYMQTLVIILSILMGSLSIVLLIFGCLAVGTSKSQIYSGFKSRRAAKITIGVFSGIVFTLFLIWLLVTLLVMVPIIGYYMLIGICDEKTKLINNQGVLSQEEKEAGPLYIVALISSIFIVIGLVKYLCCLAANYSHINTNGVITPRSVSTRQSIISNDLPVITQKRVDFI